MENSECVFFAHNLSHALSHKKYIFKEIKYGCFQVNGKPEGDFSEDEPRDAVEHWNRKSFVFYGLLILISSFQNRSFVTIFYTTALHI